MKRRLFLSLAASAAVSRAATVGETDRFIPLVLDGGGWTTTITVVNVLKKPAIVSLTFLNEKGSNGLWVLKLNPSAGTIYGNGAEIILAPGASATVSTSGDAPQVSRGFADIVELQDQLVAGHATLTRREAGAIAEQLQIPLTPANERRSVVPMDLSEDRSMQMAWVTLTTSTSLDLVFRNRGGEHVFADRVPLNDSAQVLVDIEDRWPNLAGFQGTLEWTVSFPNADRYEHRTLAGVALLPRGGRFTGAASGMTLREDQLTSSPY